MTSHYDATYYLEELAMPEPDYAMVSRQRGEKIQPYIKPSDVVFEYGVGSGLNLTSLVCRARYGFDINLSAIGIARQHGVEIVETCDGVEAAYDVVICHHVLEHLLAPADTLATLRRLLRVGGKLLLFVPYEEQRRYQRHIASDKNHHLYSWTPHTLANLVIESGFTLEFRRSRNVRLQPYCRASGDDFETRRTRISIFVGLCAPHSTGARGPCRRDASGLIDGSPDHSTSPMSAPTDRNSTDDP